MGTAQYAKGEKLTIDYTAGAAIVVDQVLVISNSVGVAQVAMANGDVGAVDLDGVYTFAKVSAAVIAQGDTVDWDASAGEVDDNAASSAAGDVANFGVALEAKGNATTTVMVALTKGAGTLGT